MNVSHLMNDKIGTIHAGETIAQAVMKMETEDTTVMLVELDRNILGVLPVSDLLKRTLSAGLDPMSTPVLRMVSFGLDTCSCNDPVEKAGAIMQEKNIPLFIVLDEEGHPVGSLDQEKLKAHCTRKYNQKVNVTEISKETGDMFRPVASVDMRNRF